LPEVSWELYYVQLTHGRDLHADPKWNLWIFFLPGSSYKLRNLGFGQVEPCWLGCTKFFFCLDPVTNFRTLGFGQVEFFFLLWRDLADDRL
jgi:hypothetical protein